MTSQTSRPGAARSGESLGTVARAIEIIRTVADSPRPLSLTELSTTLGLPTSTVHRLTRLLEPQGMVRYDAETRLYHPGEELLRLGFLLSSRWSVEELARPTLQRVVAACDETCQLSRYLPEQRSMMFVEQVRCSHPLAFTLPLFQPQPLLWGSSGRVIMAHLPPAEVEAVLAAAEASPVAGFAPPSAEKLNEDLDRIRERGWDRTDGEKLAHAVGFAAPVFDAHGIHGSVATPVPTARYSAEDHDRFVELIVNAGRELSRLLGHQG
ncbi:MAG: IclR family transcriptional regulator [Pseudonocardiaceae bacterium]|nr:MAG: IclR family transcriptional regulator [Pseudonocardiaceae bacterium]